MVGLLKTSHVSSVEKKIKNKMSDSNEKEDVVEKTETVSNGSDKEEKSEEEKPEEEKPEEENPEEEKAEDEKEAELSLPDEEKMDVDEENSAEEKSDAEEDEVVDDVEPRKGRSSRSQSSNSTSSEHLNKNEESDKKQDGSEDEDFLGFESPKDSTRQNILLNLKQRIGDDVGESLTNNEAESTDVANSDKVDSDDDQSNEKASVSDVMESGLDSSIMDTASADNDSNSGVAPTSARKGVRGSKKSISIDLSNPELRKPFEYGWVRELVYRSTTDNSVRRNADIYYYTPSGKKVRSSRELLEHLTGDLTVDNFSFFKEPIGLDDPTKEIIREAKSKPGPRGGFEDGTPAKKVATPKVKSAGSSSSTPKSTPKDTPKTVTTTPKVVFRGIAASKGRPATSSKSKLDKKRKSAGPDDVDILMDSPEWNSDQKNETNGLKREHDSSAGDSSAPPEKKPKVEKEIKFPLQPILAKASADNFMTNLNAGFVSLLHAFQYLKVHELLRASCVSRMWNFVASHNLLWETVRMKNSKVSDWNGFTQMLLKRGTRSLDLRKMLVPESADEQAQMWKDLCEAVSKIKTIVKVDMGRCSPASFVAMAEAAPQLESLVSLAIKGNEIDLLPITKCKNLTELKLKAVSGGLEVKDLSCLTTLTNLQHLALTTIKNLQGIENCLPPGLITLELGECSQLSVEFATEALPRLVHLKRLRLEKGQNDCPTLALLEAVAKLPDLVQLELINFDIKPGFEKTINKCSNLETLLIIPTYVTQSATTNHVVMGGVAKLNATLKYFIWGLTLELLKVTDLFIGQVENQKSCGKPGPPPPQKKGTGDSIPILKPCGENELKEGTQAPSQVDILALPNLQRVLSTLLPTTKIKILKVPFSATWRQTVTDAP